METQNKSDDACTKTPLIEVYYTSRSRFGDRFTEIDSEGYFSKIYPTIQEVKEEWKQIPQFAVEDQIIDIHPHLSKHFHDGFHQAPHDQILYALFRFMNDYDHNILAGYDNEGNLKMDHLQTWVQENQTHTSMSVNDVISIDGIFYLCDDIGWKTLADRTLLGKKIGPIDR